MFENSVYSQIFWLFVATDNCELYVYTVVGIGILLEENIPNYYLFLNITLVFAYFFLKIRIRHT
jgi:hypothetical protein